ncbi:hypothetical protein ES705_32303 [subsurface metagenome]
MVKKELLDDIKRLTTKGFILATAKNFQESLRYLLEAIKLDPNNSKIYDFIVMDIVHFKFSSIFYFHNSFFCTLSFNSIKSLKNSSNPFL